MSADSLSSQVEAPRSKINLKRCVLHPFLSQNLVALQPPFFIVPIYFSCSGSHHLWGFRNVLWTTKLHLTFHRDKGEKMMPEFPFFRWTYPLRALFDMQSCLGERTDDNSSGWPVVTVMQHTVEYLSPLTEFKKVLMALYPV